MTASTPTPPEQEFQPRVGGELLTPDERRGLARAGYGGPRPLTAGSWALLVVDVTWGFCGRDAGAALEDATGVYPHASGAAAWEAMPSVRALVDAARTSDVPIAFTRPARPHERPQGTTRWEVKNHRQRDVPNDAFDLVPDAGGRSEDVILAKQAPSAFFGTPLRRWLTTWRVDGVVVCGGTTSGCVRATAVDAFSHDLSVTVVADATFDRLDISHRVALLDLELKYAGVVQASEMVAAWGRPTGREHPAERTRPATSDLGGDAVPP
jgi:nicotinamidase-related amidase